MYEDYDDRVAVIGISTDTSESRSEVRDYITGFNDAWAASRYNADAYLAYRITSQSTEIVIDGNGVITHRGGYGSISTSKWREILDEVGENS